jgi:hypothetical protein
MKLLADGTSGTEIRFAADTFKIFNGTSSTAAFILDGSQLKLNVPLNGVSGTFTGTLAAGTLISGATVTGTLSAGLVGIESNVISLSSAAGYSSNGTINFKDENGSVASSISTSTFTVGPTTLAGLSLSSGWAIEASAPMIYLTGSNGVTLTGGGNQLIVSSSGVSSGANITAPDFVLSSDRSLKENIEDYVAKPININYKSYNLIGSEEKRVGVIAQELEVEHPEFVRENEEGVKSVSYIDMLVAKVSELEARIKELENGNTK